MVNDGMIFPYANVIDWDAFSVHLNKKHVPQIPAILRNNPTALRSPLGLEAPLPRGQCQLPPCWKACPPTYHAFGWIYRRQAMALLSEGFAIKEPKLEPLDIWVWELFAKHGILDKALCVPTALVDGFRHFLACFMVREAPTGDVDRADCGKLVVSMRVSNPKAS